MQSPFLQLSYMNCMLSLAWNVKPQSMDHVITCEFCIFFTNIEYIACAQQIIHNNHGFHLQVCSFEKWNFFL